MTHRLTRPVLGVLLLGTCLGAAVGASCGDNPDDALRRRVLAHIAHDVAEPTFAGFAAAAHDAEAALAALCASPGAGTLDAARAAWTAERDAWGRALPLVYGPVRDQMQQGPLDFWPARPDTIEAAVAAAPAVADAAYVAGLGTSAKGMPALEYLLFGADASAVLSALADPDGPRRCAFATALAADIATRADALTTAWSPDFADQLATPGGALGTSQQHVDLVTNGAIEALAVMVKTKLDTPLGNLTGAAVDPTLLESLFTGRAREDLETNLAAVWAVYHGADLLADPQGISALVRDVDSALDQRVRLQHDVAVSALAAVPAPIADALTTDRNAVQLARDEVDTLRRILKLDVASALGVTLALSDNDGD